eukprot:35652_1
MTFQKENFDEVTPALQIVALLTLLLLWGMLTPISLVYGFRFWVFRQCQVLKKRYSFVACIEILCVLIGFFANGCVILSDSMQATWLRQLSFHIAIFVQYCIIYCWLWRFWLIYYDMKWMVASLSVSWKRLINPRSRHHSPSISTIDWFLDHKHTYGNRQWVGIRIGIFVILCSTATIIIRYMFDFTKNEPIGETIYLFFYFVPFVGLGYLRCKLPAFQDTIYIKQEMKYIMGVLLLILCAFGIQEIAEGNFKETPNSQLIINILFYVAIECCNFICILITTRYVLRKVSILLSEQMKAAAGADSNKANKNNNNYVQLKDGDDNNNEMMLTNKQLNTQLIKCLSNAKIFDLFMRFLAKEFSIECLLSYVEFVQFKQYLRKRMHNTSGGNNNEQDDEKKEDINVETDTDLSVVFPSSVPNSEIVYSEDVSIKAKIYKFYLKYIRKNSEFEINVLDSTRKGLHNLMEDYNVWMNNNYYDETGLYHFYDQCIAEMKILLISSYKRFKEFHAKDLNEIFDD